jgi:hypothetical protein
MKNEVIGVCPLCGKNLTVTRLSCHHCNTEISGDFSLSKFSYLSKEELYFVESFLKAEGNIKEMERVLNVSYPTVKKLLSNVLTKMGYESKSFVEVDESEILQRLKRKEISVQEATELLKGK